MYSYIEERVLNVAQYIVEHGATVRRAAKEFGISKSTVHHDMRTRLKRLDPPLAKEVGRVLLINRDERHIRGGMATYRKYKGEGITEKKGEKEKSIVDKCNIIL